MDQVSAVKTGYSRGYGRLVPVPQGKGECPAKGGPGLSQRLVGDKKGFGSRD